MKVRVTHIKRWVLLLAFAVAGLILVGWLFYWPFLVKQQVEKGVVNADSIDYLDLTIQNIHYDWPWQPLSIEGLSLKINSCDQSDDFLIDFYAERLMIENFSIRDYLFRQWLTIDRVQINGSTVMLFKGKDSINADFSCITSGNSADIPVRIGLFRWVKSQLIYSDSLPVNKDSSKWTGKATIDLDMMGIQLKKNERLGMKDIQMRISDLVYKTNNDLDEVGFKEMHLDSGLKKLSVDSIVYQTQYAKDKVSEITGVESHWYQVSIPKIQWTGLSLDSLLFRETIYFKSMQMERADILVYYDKRPQQRIKNFKKLPHHWLQAISVPFRSDSISNINELNIVYQEHVKEWDEPGQISFDNTQVLIPPFNYRNDQYFTLVTTGSFMEESLLRSEIKIPVTDSTYEISGNLGPLTLTEVNPMVSLVTDSHIASGRSLALSFNFQHDQNHSQGSLDWQYDDLKIAKNEHEDKSPLIGNIESAFINLFIIKRDNHSGNGFRHGEVKFTRDETRSIFNYWWKSIASGLAASIQ